MTYISDWYEQGEAYERAVCEQTGKPWKRLTDREQQIAGEMVDAARARGHKRLRWRVPAQPWPLGAVWPDAKLWMIPIDRSYDQGRVVLTARPWCGRRHVVDVLREVSPL